MSRYIHIRSRHPPMNHMRMRSSFTGALFYHTMAATEEGADKELAAIISEVYFANYTASLQTAACIVCDFTLLHDCLIFLLKPSNCNILPPVPKQQGLPPECGHVPDRVSSQTQTSPAHPNNWTTGIVK